MPSCLDVQDKYTVVECAHEGSSSQPARPYYYFKLIPALTNARTYYFGATTPEERQRWTADLRRACERYTHETLRSGSIRGIPLLDAEEARSIASEVSTERSSSNVFGHSYTGEELLALQALRTQLHAQGELEAFCALASTDPTTAMEQLVQRVMTSAPLLLEAVEQDGHEVLQLMTNVDCT